MTTHIAAVDSHVHVFVPEKYGYSPARSYTPGRADPRALENHMALVGASKVVVVQPSPYGTDNRAALQAVAHLGRTRARAVAVVDPRSADPTEICALSSACASISKPAA